MYQVLLLVITMCPSSDEPFDPRKIPAKERVAYVNKLADRLSGENGAKDLELAAKCYTSVEDLREWDAPEAQRAACRQVSFNEAALAMADGWKGSNRRIIEEWLVANTKCLRTLKQALTFDRCYQAYCSAGGRAHIALTEMHSIRIRLAGLLAMKANDESFHGRWDAAYEWNLRIQELAACSYRQPMLIDWLLAERNEILGYQQYLCFLRRHFPADPGRLIRRVEELDGLRVPDSIQEAAEAICLWDLIETAFTWVNKPATEANYGELISSALDNSEICELHKAFGNVCPYASVGEYLSALRTSSAEHDWAAIRKADRIYRKWYREPFHEAWSKVGDFRVRYWEAVRAAPSIAVFGCPSLIQPDRGRFSAVTAGAYRRAVQTVIAIKDYERKKGKLPKSLKQLPRSFDLAAAVDPFSGEPWVYRRSVEGGDFILYSVGSDQKDDGGRHVAGWLEEGDHVFWPPQTPEVKRTE